MKLERYIVTGPKLVDRDPEEHFLSFRGTGLLKLQFANERETPVILVTDGKIQMIGRAGIGPLWRNPDDMTPLDLLTERVREIFRHLNVSANPADVWFKKEGYSLPREGTADNALGMIVGFIWKKKKEM